MDDITRNVVDVILNNETLVEIEPSCCYSSFFKRLATWKNSWLKYAYQDVETNKSLAIMFADDYDSDTIIEFALRAIQGYSGCLICYDFSDLEAAYDLLELLEKKKLLTLAIGIVVYDNKSNVNILRKMFISQNTAKERSSSEQKSYWCWWRDSSHHEVATLLELSDKYDDEVGDIYTDYVYPRFFEMMINGETLKWDGKPRVKKYSSSSFKSEKQNYKIPMFQLGLWDAETGHLTEKGHKLLSLVKEYSSHSKIYFDALAKIILIDGKHLDLIKDLDEFQNNHPEIIPECSADFFVLFDEYLINKNSMGTRKPTAVKTGAKNAYIRDEPKLWNKLGILVTYSGARYYHPFHGIEFNWKRINEILLSEAVKE